MKVLGCKVSDELYQLFDSLDGPISDHLRKAIYLYLQQCEISSNEQVNQSETPVNQQKQVNTNQNTNQIKPREKTRYSHFEKTSKPIQQRYDQQKPTPTSAIASIRSQRLLKHRSSSPLSQYKKYGQKHISLSQQETNHKKSKQPRIIQCPHCKKYITLNKKTHSLTYLNCPYCQWRIRL